MLCPSSRVDLTHRDYCLLREFAYHYPVALSSSTLLGLHRQFPCLRAVPEMSYFSYCIAVPWSSPPSSSVSSPPPPPAITQMSFSAIFTQSHISFTEEGSDYPDPHRYEIRDASELRLLYTSSFLGEVSATSSSSLSFLWWRAVQLLSLCLLTPSLGRIISHRHAA